MTAWIARVIGLLGALAAVAAVAGLVAMPELPGLRTLAVTAVIGLGGWLYLDWPAIARFAASRGGAEAARAGLLVALAAGIAAVSVALVHRADPRWDLTPEGRHSVTERTASALAALQGEPISVVGFFATSGDSVLVRHRAHWDALARAFAAASPTLQIETLDPLVSRRRAEQAGVRGNGLIIVTRGDRTERLHAPDEASLLNAILRVAHDRAATVYVTTGSGERRIDSVEAGSLTDLRQELGSLGLAVQPLDIARVPIPADAAAVLVVDPTSPLTTEVVTGIEAFVRGGGALLVAGEPGRDTGLEALLAGAGLARLPGLVVDPLVRSVTGDASTPMVSRYGSHSSVRGLRTPAVFLGGSAVVQAPHEPTDATVHVLAWTSELAWSESSPEIEPLTQDDADQPGPISLISLSELHPDGRGAGTVVLSGDADWLANEGLRAPGNRDLAVRVIGGIARQEDLVALPPRELPSGTLAMDWLAQVLVGLLAVVVLPLLCLAIGAGLWLRRRAL